MPPHTTGWSKGELAVAYFPNSVSPDAARRSLQRWIQMNPELTAQLRECGYQSRQHSFTPRQVEIIFSILGEP
ncbi:MAG: DUF4248 domain-containing protein [Bacteroidaceae bacterium]|nr:DUF4248 domain-containing protein [Bacteroidaceae bacterium]